FGWCAPAHGVSFENRDQRSAVRESVKRRISEKANKRISEKITRVAKGAQTSGCAQAAPE
ncbi:MAG TPA: hypothetical protein PKV82_11925, partial [Anaerolineae bacterium]|nr:hypothetical protein [Anaerolineae bacterium]